MGSSSSENSPGRVQGQEALHTRGLTSSFPVTENMRARPSGVHTVETGGSHPPERFLHRLPCPPLHSALYRGCSGPGTFPTLSRALDTHPGAAGPQGRRCRSRGRGGSTPRSLKMKKKRTVSPALSSCLLGADRPQRPGRGKVSHEDEEDWLARQGVAETTANCSSSALSKGHSHCLAQVTRA